MSDSYRKLLEYFAKQVTKGAYKSPSAFAESRDDDTTAMQVYETLSKLKAWEAKEKSGEDGFLDFAEEIQPRKIETLWKTEVNKYITRLKELDEGDLLDSEKTPASVKKAILEVRGMKKALKPLHTLGAKDERKKQIFRSVYEAILDMHSEVEGAEAVTARVKDYLFESAGRVPRADRFLSWLESVGVTFVLPESEAQPPCERLQKIPMADVSCPEETSFADLGFSESWLSQFGQPVLVRASGEAMAPTVLDGDLVLVDRARQEIAPGKLFAIKIEGIMLIRRLELLPGELVLRGDNRAYSPDHIGADRRNEVEIVGRVFWLGRNIT